jgi:acyl-CoA thioesterase YciA
MKYISTKVCKTSDIGVNGNLFGGMMLSWLDEAGASLASYLCCTPNMITLKIDEVLFKKPVKMGHHIRIYGKVERIGNTSIELSVIAKRLNYYSSLEDVVCSTKMTFVNIDDEGRPVAISEEVKEKIMADKENLG